MKTNLKALLIGALLSVVFAAEARSTLARLCLSGTVAYHAYDAGCMLMSTPYRMLREAERVANDCYSEKADMEYQALPKLRSWATSTKLSIASRVHEALKKLSK